MYLINLVGTYATEILGWLTEGARGTKIGVITLKFQIVRVLVTCRHKNR